jgi:hypothetical protein
MQSNRELQAKDNDVLLLTADRMQNKKSKREAVSSDTDTSESVDGTIDQDEAIYDVKWKKMYKRLRAFKDNHCHCELFWVIDCFTFILNTLTYTPPVDLLALQLMCHKGTRMNHNWAIGSTVSGPYSKVAKWIPSEKRSSTRLASISIPIRTG